MTNKELAQKLLDLLGGKDNVLANAACMTRLRVTVKDTGSVDTEGIKALDGVMGLVEDDTMQIVLGPGKVNKVLEEFSKLTGLAKGVADESVVDAAARTRPRRRPSTSPSRFRPSSRRFPMSSSPCFPASLRLASSTVSATSLTYRRQARLQASGGTRAFVPWDGPCLPICPSWWAITRHVSLVAPLRWAASPA